MFECYNVSYCANEIRYLDKCYRVNRVRDVKSRGVSSQTTKILVKIKGLNLEMIFQNDETRY